MTVETDILKTLQKIEGHLKSASTSSSSRATIGGSKNNDSNDKSYKATATALDGLASSTEALDESFKGLNKTVKMSRDHFEALNKQMKTLSKQSDKPSQSDKAKPTAVSGGGNSSPTTPVKAKSKGSGGAAAAAAVESSKGAIKGFLSPLKDVFKTLYDTTAAVVNDSFSLLGKGIGAKSLPGLYMDAAKAGMGLKEYTQVLADSTPAVARAGSLDEFAETLNKSRDGLAKLGIFGESATKLAGSMANNATTLGVSQADMSKAGAAQMSVFSKLRESTMMTSDQFKALSDEVASTQEVQSTMLGLDQQQRASKMADIMQMKTIGLQMGATAQASKALGDALISQRNLSAKQRFSAAGTIRQAGAITGMNAQDTETLAKLSRKKNLTAEEAEVATRLGAQMQAGIEKMQNSGNFNQEFIGEQLQEKLNSSGIGKLLQAAGNVGLTTESGPLQNKDFNKGASELEQGAGKLLAYASGLSENPLVTGAVAIGGAIAAALVGSKFFSTIASGMGANGGIAKSIPGGIGGARKSAISTGGKVVGSAMNAAKSIGSSAMGVGKAIMARAPDIMKGASAIASQASGMFAGMVKVLPQFLKAGLKAIPGLGTLAGVLIDGIGEAITGNVDAAFNSEGGGVLSRIGNIVFAAINGVFGGIAGLLDSAIGLFTDKGLNLENNWEKFAVGVKSNFFSLLASIAKMVTFGKDNPISSYFQEAADDSNKVLEKLQTDQSATISSIGADNKKKLDEQKTAADTTAKTLDNVTKVVQSSVGIATGTEGLADSIMQDAKNIAARGEQQPTATVGVAATQAVPAAETEKAVSPPTQAMPSPGLVKNLINPADTAALTPSVNNNTNTTSKMTEMVKGMLPSEMTGNSASATPPPRADSTSLLQEAVKLLTALVENSNAQTETADSALRSIRNSSMPSTPDMLSRIVTGF